MFRKLFGGRSPRNDKTPNSSGEETKSVGLQDIESVALGRIEGALNSSHERSRRLSTLPKMDFSSLLGTIEDIVGRQHADAQEKLANTSYWGSVGFLVRIAASSSERAVQLNTDFENERVHFDQLIETLAFARHAFRLEYDDESGFGGATFAEAAIDLMDLQLSQEGASKYTRDNFAHQLNSEAYSGAFQHYLVMTPEWFDFADALLKKNYRRCFTSAKALNEGTQRAEFWRLSARMMMLALTRLGDDQGVDDLLKLIAHKQTDPSEFDDICDALVSGRLRVNDIGDEHLYPGRECCALFWEGAYRKSQGDPDHQAMLSKSAEYDFDKYECVLASADLHLPWGARKFKTDVPRMIASLPR